MYLILILSAVSSNIVIDLPDDDDEEPPRPRKSKKTSAGKATQDVPAPETLVVEGDNVTRPTVTFAVPLTSARPSSSSAAQPSLFSTYPVPEDQASAAREAIRQAGVMMEQVKAIREASQAAYDASSALQSNVQVSRSLPVLLGYDICKLFFLQFLEFVLHPLGVCRLKFRVSGGTLSAPTGCSPQGYGRLLAVVHRLYVLSFFLLV